MNNEEFLKRHNIKVIDTNKRFTRYGPKQFMFTNDVDYNDIAQTINSLLTFTFSNLRSKNCPPAIPV